MGDFADDVYEQVDQEASEPWEYGLDDITAQFNKGDSDE